jgi:TolB-like protein/class 3 adenylate cyclase
MTETRKLAAILAADVVGFSRLTGADEDRTLARLRALRSDLIDPTIAVHNGRVVKRTGDGALVEFRSVVDAVRCAIEVQNSMVERNAGLPPERRIEFRIGIHLGDVVEESDGDLMGDGINIAARLEGVAAPGSICLSEDAYRQVKARLDLSVNDLGQTQLKNIVEPVRVYALQVGAPAQAKPAEPAPSGQSKDPSSPAGKPSIAVLAFNNMSGDPEQEYFSDGISEDIITDLSKLSELHVIARNSSFAYKQMAVPVPDMAKALGVRYVLEGSVRKAGNRVRVTAQLIDSRDGGHVWADRFDRDLTDIFAVQDELTHKIVAALKLKLTASEKVRLGGHQVDDPEAYNYLLRGREQLYLHTRSGNMSARAFMDKVIAIVPDCAAAHAYKSVSYVNDYVNGWAADPEAALSTGLDLARRAVAMDDEEPKGHFAMGMAWLWTRELDKALDAASRCIELAPSATEARLLRAHVQIFSGHPAEAIETLATYMQLDPVYPDITLNFLAEARFALGAFDQTVAALEERLARNPDSATTYALLASSLGHLGRVEEGRLAWAQVHKIDPAFSIERRRRVLPFKNPADFELRVEGLRRLGVSA